jgi:hypothetical protein
VSSVNQPGVVHVKNGATGAMLEHVAGLEIFIVESRDLAIPPFTNLFTGWQ